MSSFVFSLTLCFGDSNRNKSKKCNSNSISLICFPAPPVCRQNEKYQNCGTACPLTCDNYKNPPTVCTQQCVEDCFCEEGFVRDRNMRCVKPENCGE